MKKPVPDPPAFDLANTVTAAKPFGAMDVNIKQMFSVREGICSEDALMHASVLLSFVEATASDAADHLSLNDKALVLSIAQHAEMARALVNAVLEGAGSVGV